MNIEPQKQPSSVSKVQPPLGAGIVDVRCTEVYGTQHPREGAIIGYAIGFSGNTNAYVRASGGSLLHVGTFNRHEDALEEIFRIVWIRTEPKNPQGTRK